MAGLVPAIHVSPRVPRTWMPGTSPGMTEERGACNNTCRCLWVLAFARTTRWTSNFKQRTSSLRGAMRRSNPEPRVRFWIASLAMTRERHESTFSRRASHPSFASTLSLLSKEGAGKAGWPHAPGAAAQKRFARAR
jgi:hypothetical protein